MKPSVSLALFETKPSTPALFSGDIDKHIPLIRELGYQGVDLFVRYPEEEVSKRAIKLLKANNLGVGAVMPAALVGEGLTLSHRSADVRKTIIRRMKDIIHYAGEVGGMVSLGLVRGKVEEGDTLDEVMVRYSDSIEKLIPTCEADGIDLVVEPINRYEINTLNGSNESYDYIESSGLPLYLMLDTFHMNIEDVSIIESLRYCKDRIKHIHFLDSNRLAPGMGHLDMDGIYHELQSMSYEGYLCLEALPKPDPLTCARQGSDYFKTIGAVAPTCR